MIEIAEAQRALREEGLAGWLLYDFGGLNPIAQQAVAPPGRLLTRRWFCLLTPQAPPRWLVHAIERASFRGVPGEVRTYAGRRELCAELAALLRDCPRVAMEYSPCGHVPAISRVDAGTVELVRAAGAEVVSSGDLIQRLLARWPEEGVHAHRRAARALEDAVRAAWRRIGERIAAGRPATECEVQAWLLQALQAAGLESHAPPIVAVGAHAADPHFSPEPATDAPIAAERLLLIDIWAREPGPAGIYADITLMAYTGQEPPARLREVFAVVREARDAALALVQQRAAAGVPVRGFEADRAAREVIERAGFGAWFVHRTGHSLGPEDHWLGANLDDYETHEQRRLLPGTGFTIEPGIYVPGELGMRLEIDVFWGADGPQPTTWVQTELECITAPG
ncbi:MAG: peptidase M24 [Planctomycetota bacterium]|nr:MAG: peptidase M24 [Planctomycetota bacterium]